ncbi:hypothetical protein CEP54_007217 [Fusarium duplospermum]|uniref:Alginate lyase domain-containing protein n=1 Tax=Fusarium duplospermum TaxID=1325734 RepID=A0A428Q2L3_9HYPO|nr:hypothetical protein CEP54_007217 [Fusarium duplospermum]
MANAYAFLFLCFFSLTFAFTHPGLLVTESDIDRVKTKLAAKQEPWVSSWNKLTSIPFSAADYKDHATAEIYRSENGEALWHDAAAAFNLALRWKITGDEQFAETASNVLVAWADKLRTLKGGGDDAYLTAGLQGYELANAAELLRDYAPFADNGLDRVISMMNAIFLPMNVDFLNHVLGSQHNVKHFFANWELCNIASALAIGVLTDNQTAWDFAIDYFKHGEGNGAINNAITNLVREPGTGTVLGQGQEAGRDQGHSAMVFQLLGAIGQQTWNQGEDLFSYNNSRILLGAEYFARYNLGNDVPFEPYTNGIVSFTTISDKSRGAIRPTWELLYSHYVQIKGLEAPWTTAYLNKSLEFFGGYEGGAGSWGEGSGHYDGLGWGSLLHHLDEADVNLAKPSTKTLIPTATVSTSTIAINWLGAVLSAMSSHPPTRVIGCLLDVSDSMRQTLETGHADNRAVERLQAVLSAALKFARAEQQQETSTLLFVGLFGLNSSAGCPPVVDLCGVVDALVYDNDDVNRSGHDLLTALANESNLAHIEKYIRTQLTDQEAFVVHAYLQRHPERKAKFIGAIPDENLIKTFQTVATSGGDAAGRALDSFLGQAGLEAGPYFASKLAEVAEDLAVHDSEALRLARQMCDEWLHDFVILEPRPVSQVVQLLQKLQGDRGEARNGNGDKDILLDVLRCHLISALEEFCSLLSSARFGSADMLLDIVGRMNLDAYIDGRHAQTRRSPSDQGISPACYAHAISAVVHMALLRIVGREGGCPSIEDIREWILHQDNFPDNLPGNEGWDVREILEVIPSQYRPLRFQRVDEDGARQAVLRRRPVLATFHLSEQGWGAFGEHFMNDETRTKVLTYGEMAPYRNFEPDEDGHAVVMTGCDPVSLTFLNSWGRDWGNNGSFSIENSSVLELDGPEKSRMGFYDIYWLEGELTDNERETYNTKVDEELQSRSSDHPSIFDLDTRCPLCLAIAPIREFSGSIRLVTCPRCGKSFSPEPGHLVQALYAQAGLNDGDREA